MKNKIFLILGFIFYSLYSRDFIIDRTRAKIYDPAETIFITERDLQKPNITGEPKQLKNLCFEHLVALQAQAINLPKPDVSDILRQIDESSIFAAGYTLEEFQDEVVRYQIVNTMLDFKVYSKAIVSQEAIVDFFNKNPEFTEPRYYVKRALLDKNDYSKDFVENMIQNKKNFIEWEEPFWIAQKEIAAEKLFLIDLALHEIKMIENPINFELYTVIAREEQQQTPLESSYQKIVLELKQPLVKKLFEDYQAEILDGATYTIYE
jgi:hypothetical protein